MSLTNTPKTPSTKEGGLDTLFDKYNEFIKFEMNEIDLKLLELPSMVGLYQNIFYTLKQKHTKYQYETDSKWTERYLYYKNDFNFTLSNAEIKSFIEKDIEYLNLKLKTQKVVDVLEQVEIVLKGLDSMRWTIKSLIDWEKFKQGEF